MAEMPKTNTTVTGQGQQIPTMGTQVPKHWWYDRNQAGVGNSPPLGGMNTVMGSYSTSPRTSVDLTSDIPKVTGVRRDSLKNMMHLGGDFATQ